MSSEVLDLQVASRSANLPANMTFKQWVDAALATLTIRDASLTIRIVDAEEIRTLNRTYRHQDKETNVLSFPFEAIEGIEQSLLGDVIICSSVVEREALEQKKSAEAHWAHLVIHGILHLCGYDHISENEAEEMEALELRILSDLGYPDPYRGYDK